MKKNTPSLADQLDEALDEAIAFSRGTIELKTRTLTIPRKMEYDASAIARLRLRFHLSQAAFAKLLGVSARVVEMWESGNRKPNSSAMRLLQMFDQPQEFNDIIATVNDESTRLILA